MPERELPEHLRAKLSNELTSGAPLVAPLPADARYATITAAPAGRLRWRLSAAASAVVALIAVAVFAGGPQARSWIGQSVDNIARGVVGPGEQGQPSASPQSSAHTESPEASPSEHEAAPSPSPEPSESPQPSESPAANESPRPSQSPEPDDSPRPSPPPGASPSPSPSGE